VLDNVDELEIFDTSLLFPRCSHGTIIMTSRRMECTRDQLAVAVDEMPQDAIYKERQSSNPTNRRMNVF